jgi:tRNA dimethylallyltransferase
MRIVVLVGPTASGKTAVGIRLAKLLGGEIVCADSRQVYKYLDIGTAKPKQEQRAQVRHHFVDMLDPDAEFSAGQFGVQGRSLINDLLKENKVPIVVGGSGLYIKSLIDGLCPGPGTDKELRSVLQRRLEMGEVDELLDELKRVDPHAAARADRTKPRRIIRALEVYHSTGKPITDHHREARVAAGFVAVQFGLNWDRRILYHRIERRCEQMIEEGLLEEVEQLEKLGYGPSLNALNTVGYVEAFRYRRGEISFEEMVRLFKQNSRRYAKRQLTWFRHDPRIQWVQMNEGADVSQVAGLIAQRFLTNPKSALGASEG